MSDFPSMDMFDEDEDTAFGEFLSNATERLDENTEAPRSNREKKMDILVPVNDAIPAPVEPEVKEEPVLVVALDRARNLNLQMQRALEAIGRQDPGKTPTMEQQQLAKHVETQITNLIGCRPICLRDPEVQRSLIAQNPDLEGAFKSKMLRGFVMGLDNAGLSLCIGFAFLAMVQNLLKECLRKQKLDSDGRQQFNKLMVQISEQMDLMLNKTDQFVGHMSVIVRRVGSASHLLQMGASVDKLVATLTDVCDGIAEEANSCEGAAEEIQTSVRAVGQFVNSKLQSDDMFELLQTKLRTAAEKHQEALVELDEKTSLRSAQRGSLISAMTATTSMMKTAENERKQLSTMLNKFDVRLEGLFEKIGALEDKKVAVIENRVEEIKTEERPTQVTKEMVQDQIDFEKEQIELEIKRLELRRVGCVTKGEECLSKAEVASDGKERVVEKRHSFFTFLLRQDAPDRLSSVQVHDNEKERFQGLADRYFASARRMERQIRDLKADLLKVEMRVLSSMQAAVKKAREEKRKALEEGYNATVAHLDCQIKDLNALKTSTEAQRAHVAMRLQSKQEDVGSLKETLTKSQQKLQEHESGDDTLFRQVARARDQLDTAELNLERAQKEIDEFVEKMELADMDDFRVYIQTLEILTDTVQQVPLAIRQLNNSLAYTYKMFESEMFKTHVTVFESPEARAAYLMKTTLEVHALCEVAWQAANVPLKSLLTHNSSNLVNKLIAMKPIGQLEAPNGVVITEVEDDVQPQVETEVQEDDRPRRRQY